VPERASELLTDVDYWSVLLIYTLSLCFGFVGGFSGASMVFIGYSKKQRWLSIAFALGVSGAITAVVILSCIFSYQILFSENYIDNFESIVHISLFSGFATSIITMIINKGIANRLVLKYKGFELELKEDEK
jgi:hypothetical protein